LYISFGWCFSRHVKIAYLAFPRHKSWHVGGQMAKITKRIPVFCFYGRMGEKGIFSNFFDQSNAPFTFEVPEQFFRFAVTPENAGEMLFL